MRNKLWTLTFLEASHSLIPDQQVLRRRLTFHICLNIYVWASCRRHFPSTSRRLSSTSTSWLLRRRLRALRRRVGVLRRRLMSNFVTNGLPYGLPSCPPSDQGIWLASGRIYTSLCWAWDQLLPNTAGLWVDDHCVGPGLSHVPEHRPSYTPLLPSHWVGQTLSIGNVRVPRWSRMANNWNSISQRELGMLSTVRSQWTVESAKTPN